MSYFSKTEKIFKHLRFLTSKNRKNSFRKNAKFIYFYSFFSLKPSLLKIAEKYLIFLSLFDEDFFSFKKEKFSLRGLLNCKT